MRTLANKNEVKENLVSIFLILSFAFGTNVFISDVLYNTFGIPWLRYQKLYFVFIPILIIFKNRHQEKIRVPYLISFLVLLLVFYFMETYLYGSNYIPKFGFIREIIYVYIGFLALVNNGLQRYFYIKTLKYSLILILINTIIIYASIIGIINFANIEINELSGRLSASKNLNVSADMNVLGIFLLYILKKENTHFKVFNLKIRNDLLTAFLLILVFVNSVRGSMVLFLFGFAIYVFDTWGKIDIYRRIIYILSFSIMLGYGIIINVFQKIASQFFLFERLFYSSYTEGGRSIQIIASWENFIKNPIIGIGYENAAIGIFDSITISNFQYTQLLGSGGIILFILFFIFFFKMFGAKIYYIRKNIIILSLLLFMLFLISFRPLSGYHAIIAYIVYYIKFHLKFDSTYSRLSYNKPA